MLNSYETLRSAQIVLIEGLKEIDRVCRIHNIEYWIDSGTLLGAKRQGKFIEWDEDIDICMTRENFDKFMLLANHSLNKDLYFLQNKITDKHYDLHPVPAKLRVNNTKLLWTDQNGQEYNYNKLAHSGLYIDIFAMDKTPRFMLPGNILKLLYKIYYQRRYNNKTLYKKTISLFGKVFIYYPMLEFLNKKYIKWVNKYPKAIGYDYCCDMGLRHYRYTNEMIFPLSSIEFEGNHYPCPAKVHEYLCETYGSEYMIPPKVKYQHGIIKKIFNKEFNK
ncbi:phosphorylcholine transferase LicD [Providencia rettgeri]|uniref:LicD family protein n=1 Tax=Providencia rettgeri TaxID=587 RepID=UPI0034E08F98